MMKQQTRFEKQMRKLEGKVILVAGGGGVGNELARKYAAEGAKVVIGDNHPERGEKTVAEILATGGTASTVPLDGTDEGTIAAAVAHAKAVYGGLDGMHANFAALSMAREDSDPVNISMAVYDKTMEVNARGFLLCTRHAVPAIVERGGGAIIYTSSIAAHVGDPILVAYAMSKAAVHALMRNVAKAYGPSGVRANVIAAGMIETPAWDAIPTEYRTAMENTGKARAAIKSRVARPQDIAAIGTMLMSDDGAYVTGQVLSVDGGTTMLP